MLRGTSAVFVREMYILRRRLPKLACSWSVSPLLYMVAFGYAMGDTLAGGRPYAEFLLPGLIAMSSMTQAWGIASDINIARFYWRIFEEFQAAPIHPAAYVTGEIAAGVVRALLASCLIMAIGLLFGVDINYLSPMLWLAAALNALVFASLAVALAMLVKSHADQAMLTSFVITPMAFLGGTFFPMDRLPGWVQPIMNLLPLTHSARAVRAAAFGQPPAAADYMVLCALGLCGLVLAGLCVDKAKD